MLLFWTDNVECCWVRGGYSLWIVWHNSEQVRLLVFWERIFFYRRTAFFTITVSGESMKSVTSAVAVTNCHRLRSMRKAMPAVWCNKWHFGRRKRRRKEEERRGEEDKKAQCSELSLRTGRLSADWADWALIGMIAVGLCLEKTKKVWSIWPSDRQW